MMDIKRGIQENIKNAWRIGIETSNMLWFNTMKNEGLSFEHHALSSTTLGFTMF